ncbi:MAG: hypothetical protein IT162_01755 [Bryobacterales bacterium]|nr:hypothetical protein [Bryobacterales bacterium]
MKTTLAIAAALSLAACQPSPPPVASAPPAPAYFTPDPATAGSVRGRVTLVGRPPAAARLAIEEDVTCAQLNPQGLRSEEFAAAGAGGAMANVLVYVKKGLEGKTFAPPPKTETVTIDQRQCRFAPHVFGIRAGQTLRVTNSDPLTHNIHPQPKNNREWNQSQEEGAAALERRFPYPELMVRIKCNVHPWMRAYVHVLAHPYFAVTGADGTFELASLPPGDYVIEALHEKAAPVEQAVHVDASGRVEANLQLRVP